MPVTSHAPVQVHLAISVGAPDRAGVEARLAEARRWLTYLLEVPDTIVGRIAWSAPWALYAQTFFPGVAEEYFERISRDVVVAMRRADAVVALGRYTPWVAAQLEGAETFSLPTLNLCTLGPLPPRGATAQWWEERPHADTITQLRGLVAAVDRRRAARETPSA